MTTGAAIAWTTIFIMDQVIPTLMLYGGCLWLIHYAIRKRRFLLILLAIAPFVQWAVQRARVERQVAAADQLIAGTPKSEMPEPRPTTLVLPGARFLPLETLASLRGIKTVIRKSLLTADPSAYDLLDLTSLPPRRLWYSKGAIAWRPVQALPEEYLLLRSGRDSRYIASGHYTRLGTPFQLRHVAPGRDELVALQVSHSRSGAPMSPPVLSALVQRGWRELQDITTLEEEDTAFKAFAEAAIGVSSGTP